MSLLSNLVSELKDLVETDEGANKIAITVGATYEQKMKVAKELYRIVKYPNGPTAKKYKALLEEGLDFSDETIQTTFEAAVVELLG